ncbi:hypothetical protein BKA63DRAFT_178754 [Paraphoma chrysanthemicola]|nr:hypothetical protein BKA63DRAFT_178754 [Paraphoma chrysanthemicola]
MSSNHSSSANSIEIDARRADLWPANYGTNGHSPHGESRDILHPRPQTILTRHYSSLQEHANHLNSIDTSGEDDGLTPRTDNRRDGFTWGSRPGYDDQRTYSRNPLPPEQLGTRTPPPLEELLRRPTNEDADSAHNNRQARVDTFDFQPPVARTSNASTVRLPISRQDTARSSIAGFARGLARHVPNMKSSSPAELVAERQHKSARKPSRSESSGESYREAKKERRLSFLLPPSTKAKEVDDAPQRKASLAESSAGDSAKAPSVPSSTKSSLRDRRKVNLDLALSTEIPDLPAQSRPPVGQLRSITPSRPRSPKTPWIRDEPLKWQHHNAGVRTAPILEEGYIGEATVGDSNEEGVLLPGDDPIVSSQSPHFERPPVRVRDRCRITRPRTKRSRSGTSESTLAQTPDGSWTPDDPKALKEQQAQTKADLERLGQVSKRAQSSRWRWARSATRSSEGSPQKPNGEPSDRRFSINPFKRSGRFGDEMDRHKEKKQSTSSNRAWWIGKQAAPQAHSNPPMVLSNMPLPPTFVPPGVNRVPTPPSLDANGEVKGKLADFFFDHGTGITGKKPKASPGGYWDSDALLMSYLSSDMNLGDDDEDEGPEGPLTPNPAVRAFTVDRNPSYDTPGLVTAPGNYLDAKTINHSYHPGQNTPFPDGRDVWFRIQQPESPDDQQLTVAALREIDERRKFEWIVPEHLPNSPLCPLHAKYEGYSKGRCYWHGRRKSNNSRSRTSGEYEGGVYETGRREKKMRLAALEQSGERVEYPTVRRGSRGWEVGSRHDAPKQPQQYQMGGEVKKRRLESLSTP